jgi:hypothetical protein
MNRPEKHTEKKKDHISNFEGQRKQKENKTESNARLRESNKIKINRKNNKP